MICLFTRQGALCGRLKTQFCIELNHVDCYSCLRMIRAQNRNRKKCLNPVCTTPVHSGWICCKSCFENLDEGLQGQVRILGECRNNPKGALGNLRDKLFHRWGVVP